MVINLHNRCQQHEPHVSDACCEILHDHVCNCRNEYTQHHSIQQAFETLVVSLRHRFQQHEPQVYDVCCKILHHVCNCRNEYTQHHSIHQAFETLGVSLRDRFQQLRPHISDACCEILHQVTVDEVVEREAFDRLNCILVNEPGILKEATEMLTVYMDLGECLKLHMDIAPMDTATLDRILDFNGY